MSFMLFSRGGGHTATNVRVQCTKILLDFYIAIMIKYIEGRMTLTRKVFLKEDIMISKRRMATAVKKYNELMFQLGLEFNTIGTDFSEETENWGIREMLDECEYQLEMYYEEGTNQYDALHDMDDELMTLETLMDKDKFTKYMIRKDWVEDEKKKVQALRKFINTYKKDA